MFLIKEFQESESKALICLLNEQFKDNGWKKENEENLDKRVISCLQAQEAKQLILLLAIDHNATVVGYVLIQWLKELWTDFPEAFISSFYVRALFRQKGVGTLLLEAAIKEVRKRNCMRLFLENNRENSIYEKKFYPKRGWKERTDVSIFEFPTK